MECLEAGGYLVAIVGGIAGAFVFISNWLKRYAPVRYPQMGEAGRNILSRETDSVFRQERVSLSAEVPDQGTLLVVLSTEPVPEARRADVAAGVGPDSGPPWGYSVAPAPLNWRGRRFEKEVGSTGARQRFAARSGPAELELFFDRIGEVVVSVYERGDEVPTWSKTIQVLPRPAGS
nr:hypothetical protein [Stenotrophomonas maltophilia]